MERTFLADAQALVPRRLPGSVADGAETLQGCWECDSGDAVRSSMLLTPEGRHRGEARTVAGEEVDDEQEAVVDGVVGQVEVAVAWRVSWLVAQVHANSCRSRKAPDVFRCVQSSIKQPASRWHDDGAPGVVTLGGVVAASSVVSGVVLQVPLKLRGCAVKRSAMENGSRMALKPSSRMRRAIVTMSRVIDWSPCTCTCQP